jgi:hypothetical protein
MSLQDRISAQSKLDTDLLVQNNRIGKSARKQENKVLPFKQVDEELLREYNSQFPTGFEYTDEFGEKKFRKYMLPQDAPELDEPVLEFIASDREVQDVLDREADVVRQIQNVKDALKKNAKDTDLTEESINDGSIPSYFGKRELDKLNDDFFELKTRLQELEDEIPAFNHFKSEHKRRIEANKVASTIASQDNKKKIDKYKEELNILNSKAFQTEQLPSETEAQYYERLRHNAEFTEPEENLENAKQLTLNRFKNSLKEIIRNNTKLEQISNTIDPFGEVGNKLKLLKKWNLFKTRYIKVFGKDNYSITVDDIIAFMNEFLEDGGKVTEEEEKEDIPLSVKERISELSKALMVKYGTKKEMKDRLKNYNLEHRDGDNDYFQGITSDRRDNIAKQVARQIIIHNKTNEEVGFGIKTEKIPEKVTFGKLVLLLHKLYYKNILAVKHHNMISIAGLKNTKVSEKFVKIVMGMVEGIHPTVTEINGLSVAEKQLYDRLIHLAGLNKMIPHTQDKTITDLKKRMKLIEAEISAGNNSPILLQELYVIVHSLKDFGVLSQKDIKQYLSQF